MSEYDRRVKIIETVCTFCPVCAAELVTETVTRKALLGSMQANFVIRKCPNGHGEMSGDMAAGNMSPCAVFDLSEELFLEQPSG
jgi:hypothetical protein